MRILVLLFALLAACNKDYSSEAARPALLLGDSIAYGTGSSNQRFNLASCLGRQTGAYFRNMGVPGETTRELIKRLEAVISIRPRLVVLSIAGNDLRVHIGSSFTNFPPTKPLATWPAFSLAFKKKTSLCSISI